MAASGKPKGLFLTGIALMTLALIGTIGAVALGVAKTSNTMDEIRDLNSTPLGQSVEFMGSGQDATVWYTGSNADGVSCLVSNEAGATATFDTSKSVSLGSGSDQFALIGKFVAPVGESFNVTCGPESSGGGFAVSSLSIGSATSGVLLLFGGLVGGFVVWLLGFILWIISLFKRSSWKKRNAASGGQMPPPGAFGQPPAPAGYGQSPYGAPPAPASVQPPAYQPPSNFAPPPPAGPPASSPITPPAPPAPPSSMPPPPPPTGL